MVVVWFRQWLCLSYVCLNCDWLEIQFESWHLRVDALGNNDNNWEWEHKAMVAQLWAMRAQKPTGWASFYFCFFSLGHCKDIWSSNTCLLVTNYFPFLLNLNPLSAINSYCNFVSCYLLILVTIGLGEGIDSINQISSMIFNYYYSAHLETVNYSTCVSLKKTLKMMFLLQCTA